MNAADVNIIEREFVRRLSRVSIRYKRYLYDAIHWDARLIGICGARGVGKTTLLLQRIKLAHKNTSTVFYTSLDSLWFNTHSLPDLVEWLYQRGMRWLYLDEVHKYPHWAQVIKNLYDIYDDLHIVYTGSSMLEIDNSRVDLSRRQSLYRMRGLSFREYLLMTGVLTTEAYPLPTLLENHTDIAETLCQEISILKHFETYLQRGYYPFSQETGAEYFARLAEVVTLVIESDMPAIEKVTYATIQKARQLLMIIGSQVPFSPNIAKLSAQLETTRDVCLKLLYTLDRADLLLLATRQVKNYKHLVNPDKIYLNNTNLMYALSPTVNNGTERETFFLNQLSAVANINVPEKGDFLIDNKYLFEIGGHGKDYTQIANIDNSFVAADDIEVGRGNKIPLWMFGLLY